METFFQRYTIQRNCFVYLRDQTVKAAALSFEQSQVFCTSWTLEAVAACMRSVRHKGKKKT